MTINKCVAAAALLAMSSVALADTNYDFDTITNLPSSGYSVTGVLVNDTVPTTLSLNSSRCFEWMELMMKRPGKFTLTVTVTTSSGGGFPTPPVSMITSCQLNAKP